MKNSFFLVIPPPLDDEQALTSYSEGALRQWLADLPTGNPGLATRLLQDRVAELTRLNMPTLQRLSALEIIRAYFLRIEEFLRARLSSNRFPKNETENKIAHWLLLLEKEYTIAYWMVVQDLTRRTVAWQHQKAAVLALHRTINGLSSLIVSHYLLGVRVHDWIWYDIHSLYQLAQKLDKLSILVNDSANPIATPTSIEQCYRRILLFSLVTPSGLMQKEVLTVYQFVLQLTPLISLSPGPVADMPLQCLLTLDEDLPPRFMDEQQIAAMKRNDALRVFVNLSEVAALSAQSIRFATALVDRFNPKVDESNANPLLPLDLFTYLIQRWRGLPHQGSNLFEDRLDRLVTIGLDATHEIMAEHQSAGVSELAAETRSSHSLCIEQLAEGLISIGSLVGVRKTTEPPASRVLGIVSALQSNAVGSGMVLDVQLIAQRCYPVGYRAEHSDTPDPHKALLYTLGEGENSASFILLESFLIKEEDILTLYMGEETFPIVLKQRRNIGLGYWQFECRRILDEANNPAPRKKMYDFT